MSLTDFVADVERLLTRAHELFPECGATPLPAHGDSSSVPVPLNHGSGLRTGATAVASSYQLAQDQLSSLNEKVSQAINRASATGEQGRVASALILDQARALGAVSPSLARTPAGTRMLVVAMDQHLSAMQTQVQSARSEFQNVSAALQQAAAGYRTLAGEHPGDGAVAALDNNAPKDSPRPAWTPGDPRHRPYTAGPGGPPPPTGGWAGPGQSWIEIGPGSGTYVRADELPGAILREPGVLGPLLQATDEHGLQVPYIEVAPHSGVWAPVTDFPDMHFAPPHTFGPPGTEEYIPGSGMWTLRDSLIPEPATPPHGHP